MLGSILKEEYYYVMRFGVFIRLETFRRLILIDRGH